MEQQARTKVSQWDVEFKTFLKSSGSHVDGPVWNYLDLVKKWWDISLESAEYRAPVPTACCCCWNRPSPRGANAKARSQPWCLYNPMNSRGRIYMFYLMVFHFINSPFLWSIIVFLYFLQHHYNIMFHQIKHLNSFYTLVMSAHFGNIL